MEVIHDPVHGTIRISRFEEALIQTPQFQRLRGIQQLAMAYFVYPGANHTRFEHSLGTIHMAGRIADQLGLSTDERVLVRGGGCSTIWAILHSPMPSRLFCDETPRTSQWYRIEPFQTMRISHSTQ